MEKAKILVWDIEASNLKADYGIVLAFGYKFVGEESANVLLISDFPKYKKDKTDDSAILKKAIEVMESADIWVTYYGKHFDIRFIKARMMYHGLGYLPNIQHVDLYDHAKTHMLLSSGKLANVADFLKLPTEKTRIDGRLWVKAMSGDKQALEYIRDHCLRDVQLTEELYKILGPAIIRHPRVSFDVKPCSYCGGEVQLRGSYPPLAGQSTPRYRVCCKVCGRWEIRLPQHCP